MNSFLHHLREGLCACYIVLLLPYAIVLLAPDPVAAVQTNPTHP